MNISTELLSIFRSLNGQSIRLMNLRKLLSVSIKESAIRKAIYELERASLIERIAVPKHDGLCYKIVAKTDG